ncbi:hypothetical protein BCR33DRAFT_720239 [Rhizoclosmatium globosum]|uniref:Uncharacterized protein n=1 Tax=Rhizoclosmatium globosum TaxID=329046 RepID=A0A1Y2BXL6_9FUNG|nr:hypothetical protein BCR33DRAFT_720239 [Rhizoclosmatium globosum]|eukprot:ORY39414.1 hypothetical protein BCR33DRAFT_720239 [Rhizoclosmatium globosum]
MRQLLMGLVNTFPYREDIAMESGSGATVIGSIVVYLCDTLGGVDVIAGGVAGMVDPKWTDAEKREWVYVTVATAVEKKDMYRVDVLMHEYGIKYRRRNNGRKG